MSTSAASRPSPGPVNTSALALRRTSFWFALLALLCMTVADLAVTTSSPGLEIGRMAQGLLTPTILSWQEVLTSLANTLAFALQGIALATICGFCLALCYRFRLVRGLCAFVRAIHELFWALIFIQVFGLSSLTGLLAIAIPYAGTLAKIYGELFEESNPAPRHNLFQQQGLSAFCYTTLPLTLGPMLTYTSYRFECAIRSSVVLGFVGLPTLGFHLETTLREGLYGQAAALLYLLLAVIGSLRFWLRRQFVPLYLLAALVFLPPQAQLQIEFIVRFFTEDIVPAPLRYQDHWDLAAASATVTWLASLWREQMLPGIVNTLLLSQIALVATALVALCCFPLNSRLFFKPVARTLGDSLLVILRTIPEYLLAFIGLLVFGPSMLPAIIALALHNGAIIGHLIGQHSEELHLRQDSSEGVNRYAFEVLPRIFRQFLSFLFYRWEVIMRESAILGILGISTLGFYIDSAFEEFRFDRAILLILVSALLNIAIDAIARGTRHRLHLKTTPESL